MRTKKTVEINRFDNFDNNSQEIRACKFYNYFPTYQLKNSNGIRNALFPRTATNKEEREINISTGITSVEGIGYFKQYFAKNQLTMHRLLIYGNDNKVYINQMLEDDQDMFWLYSLEFNSAPIILPFKKEDVDAVILASEDQMKIWTTGYSPYTISNVPIITSMCMNDGVLFCTIKDPAFKIWYATDLNAENVGNISKNSGFIMLADDLGYARKVVTFNEEVYVFRDYGITKISYLKGESIVSEIYQSNTKIYANTVSVCGNNILFMTNSGLYSFNGVKVSKTSVTLLNAMPIENDGAVASSLGEKYYLALNLNFEDGKQILCENECVNNVLLVIDTNNFSYEIIRGVDIKTMLPVKTDVFEKMLVLFNTGEVNKIGEVTKVPIAMEQSLPKFWSSESLVNNVNTKLFTKLTVNSDEGIKFTLKYDDKEINFTTYNSGINEFIFKIICKDIKLEISTSKQSGEVKKVILDYYEY